MVVERGQGVFQDPDVQKTLQADLQNAQTAICDEHDSRQQEGEGVAALERQHGDEKAHGAAAGIAHQQAGGLGIQPQVGQQRTDEHHTSRSIRTQFGLISQQVGANGNHCQTGGKAVHTIGAVDHVDACPDQDDDEQQVHCIRQGEAPLQKVYAAAIEVQVGDARQHRDDKIDDAFFVLIPGGFGGIVQITGEHGGDQQHIVHHILCVEGQKRQRHQCDAQHKDQSGASRLALGKLAVHRKGAAVIVGQFIAENGICQGGQGKCQQKCHGLHAPLPDDRGQHLDHKITFLFLSV